MKAASEIPTRTVLGVTVISAQSRLSAVGGADALSAYVEQLLADGVRRIVVDLQGMKKFDSAGIGLFVSLPASASRWGGILAFAGVPRRLLEVLEITQVTSVWSTSSGAPPFLLFETVDEAVAAVLEAQP